MLKKFFHNNLFIILFVAAGFLVIAVAVYTGFFISYLSGYFKDSIDKRLRFISRSAAHLVSPEELAELQTPPDMEKPVFSEIRQRIINFGEEAEVLYVYYVWPLPDDKYQYIVDNDETENTVNLLTDPAVHEKAFSDVLTGKTVVMGLGEYPPGEEGLLTSYSPIFDRDGKVIAAVGIDIADEQILDIRNRIFILSFITVLSTSLVVVIGVLSLYTNSRKQEAFLNRIRQQELMSLLSRSFITSQDTGSLISGTLRITGEFMDVSRIVIGLMGAGTGINNIPYVWQNDGGGFNPPDVTGLHDLLQNSFPAKQPEIIPTVFCNDIQKEKRYELLDAVGVKAFLWAPLYVESGYWAILSVEEHKPRVWTQSDRQLISLVSSVVAGAIERDLREKERDAARQAAERASQAKTDFLANMSHEMRTPMNAIIGMTSIAKSSHDLEKKEYCLTKIENASTHLLGVINDILDMSKIEANKFELSFAEFNFEKMLQKVVNVINFKIDEKNQIFSVHFDKNIPSLFIGDDMRLAQVITNLLSNAIKFTPDGGTVTLNAGLERREGDLCTLKVTVKDSGIGISPQQQNRLFSSFEQADTSTSRQFGGTGLGLAISKRIVEMMDGSFTVDSELGKGAVFSFTVQLQEAAGDLESATGPDDWSSVRVLAVDDDHDILAYFNEIAGRIGFSCDTAASGRDALEMIRLKGDYDICFVDWKMPGMDGIELSRQIKQLGGKAIVIMISAVDWNTVETEAKNAGISSFLSKPLFPSLVADCISNYIKKDRETPSGVEEEELTGCFEGKRLLLAEDVDLNREIVMSLLEPTGLSIDCAENGAVAVKLFKQSPSAYDLIFMDVQMPEMDGYQATRNIRAFEAETGKREGVPIIAMTANVFKEDVERCLEAGMNCHVGKPINFDEVLTQMRRFLI